MKGGTGQHPKKKMASEEVPGRPGSGGGVPWDRQGHMFSGRLSAVMNPPLLSRTVRKMPGLMFPRG